MPKHTNKQMHRSPLNMVPVSEGGNTKVYTSFCTGGIFDHHPERYAQVQKPPDRQRVFPFAAVRFVSWSRQFEWLSVLFRNSPSTCQDRLGTKQKNVTSNPIVMLCCDGVFVCLFVCSFVCSWRGRSSELVRKTTFFLSFPYVCPEPVLVK